MNGYLRPSVFWAMVSFASLLFLMCLFAGPSWAPWVLGIVIAATVVEWAIEQHWLGRMKLGWLEMELGWLDGDLESINEQMDKARLCGDRDTAFALSVFYTERVKQRQHLRMAIADLRYQLQGELEGIDYPRI